MSVTAVLLPLFVHVLLVFVLLVRLGTLRVPLVRSRVVKPGDIALGQKAWPEAALKAGNAFDNQFQLPVLFYVLTALALVTRQADLLFVVLAWLFVVSRIVHAAIHSGGNHIVRRFQAYFFGFVVLAVMWIAFAVGILASGA